jgi:BirA family biotin operon repressor/biotin-[acetyl-CoA-carboxylase] ligase
MLHSLLSALPQDYPYKEHIHYFQTIDSTNSRAKAMGLTGAPHGTALVAKMQTAGRGRLGRSFHSPNGQGIYLSMVLRPGCHAKSLMHLTCAVGSAVCDAIESVIGLRPGIKWTNDLVFGKRKLGGILTELSLDNGGNVNFAVVGIGINCTQKVADFPVDIRDIATSLEEITGNEMDISQLTAAILSSLLAMSDKLLSQQGKILEQYRRDCVTLGKEISVVTPSSVRHGIAVDIDQDGALVVDFPDGHRETVNSGEVSIRGMYGYV